MTNLKPENTTVHHYLGKSIKVYSNTLCADTEVMFSTIQFRLSGTPRQNIAVNGCQWRHPCPKALAVLCAVCGDGDRPDPWVCSWGAGGCPHSGMAGAGAESLEGLTWGPGPWTQWGKSQGKLDKDSWAGEAPQGPDTTSVETAFDSHTFLLKSILLQPWTHKEYNSEYHCFYIS